MNSTLDHHACHVEVKIVNTLEAGNNLSPPGPIAIEITPTDDSSSHKT